MMSIRNEAPQLKIRRNSCRNSPVLYFKYLNNRLRSTLRLMSVHTRIQYTKARTYKQLVTPIMFSLKNFGRTGRNDFSLELRDKEDWVVGTLKTLEYHLDITAFAIDPVSSLLAIGTSTVSYSQTNRQRMSPRMYCWYSTDFGFPCGGIDLGAARH